MLQEVKLLFEENNDSAWLTVFLDEDGSPSINWTEGKKKNG